ncbi:B-box zinc finger protein [Marinobacter salexigens]|uniref:B-box zinc finger protein n=1 Tax=Marinobacter salexigens TaxID=1925763 RepID=UPI000C2815F5|nr:B-box zinc finger protein [Marinobacter salexigens]
MKHDCYYHPGDPAKWHCGECQIHFCSRCMPDADTRQRRALCPSCSKAMRYMGAATEVVPFWNRIGAFFRYPFHTDPLIVIAICTLVPLVAPANLVGILIWLVLALALFKYTYAVINHTAEGHLTPPTVSIAFTGSGFNIVILQLLVFIVMGGLVGAAAMLGGPLLMLLALAFVVLALPASIMVLAMERSVGAAVNPMNLAVLISRIGTPYFLLYGYLILLTLASGVAQDFAYNHFPFWFSQPLSGFLNSTFTLILFNMLGYLLFQYQEELGFASDIQDDSSDMDMQQRDRSTRLDADIDMNLKDGNYDRVQGMLKEALKRNREDPLRIGQLYQLLVARNDATELYQYHPRILGWLADRNDGEGIASVVSMLDAAEPGFKLDDPELAVRCARCLYHREQYKLALRLLQDFHKRFPESDELAPAYLLVAQTLANGLNQWEKATAFLTFIQKRCVNHPLHEQVPVFLEQAEKKELLKGPKASFAVPD